jgi:hypothetical protein
VGQELHIVLHRARNLWVLEIDELMCSKRLIAALPVGDHVGDVGGLDLQFLVQEDGAIHLEVGVPALLHWRVAHVPVAQLGVKF